MRILLAYFSQFINRSGGMEHVCCEFANAMTARGHHVDIVYASPIKGHPFYPVSDDVNLYNLFHLQPEEAFDSGRYLSHVQKIWRECIRLVNPNKIPEWNADRKNLKYNRLFYLLYCQTTPDIIVSFEPQTTAAILYKEGNLPPIITMMHFNPGAILNNRTTNGEKKGIIKSCFVQVLMPSFKRDIHKMFPQAHVICISNIVPQYLKCADLMREKNTYKIINVGRLARKQKQQHLLVQAFARLAPLFPNWQLELWGEEQKSHKYTKELRDYIQSKHLEKQIFIRGVANNVFKIYLQSDIFGFPSAYEGFPLAMTEAMSAGLPVIGLKSCPSVNEIIQDGKTGFLVDSNVDDLARKLEILMKDRFKRIKIGHDAHIAMKKYNPDLIWKQWEDLLRYSIQCY